MPEVQETPPAVGIMADSHGDAAAIKAAMAVLGPLCDRIYHLGDICDSLQPDTVDDCVAAVRVDRVLAIRGNNDHVLVANRLDRGEGRSLAADVSQKSIAYLSRLPYVREFRKGCFTHSLPFERELGPGCMRERLSRAHTVRWCRDNPGRILFRGHSHTPEMRWLERDRLRQRTLGPGARIQLDPYLPCIVTCGALTEKVCMTWRPGDGLLTCLQTGEHTHER
jgi:predicted phosphodiesterase